MENFLNSLFSESPILMTYLFTGLTYSLIEWVFTQKLIYLRVKGGVSLNIPFFSEGDFVKAIIESRGKCVTRTGPGLGLLAELVITTLMWPLSALLTIFGFISN